MAEESRPDQHIYQNVVSCEGLTAPSWKNHEVETTLDMHNGLLTVAYFGVDDSDVMLTIRYEDRACEENPTLRALINHAVTTANEDIAGDCRALKERLATGNFTVRERTLDPEAVVAYIERWCQ